MHALVFGGTSGIGLAIANGFAAAGWTVTAAGLDLLDSVSTQSVRLTLVEADVTDALSVAGVVQQCSRIDALINTAGVIRRHEEFELETFQQVLDVNLTGTMRACMAAKEKLVAAQGSVVNIASMLSFFGGGVVPGYSASKGGVAQLTKSLAIAWAGDGVRVNAIAPGWIATPMTDALRTDAEREEAVLSRTPMGRWGRPQELVGPSLFLTSPDASFITGAVLTVDGGYSVM